MNTENEWEQLRQAHQAGIHWLEVDGAMLRCVIAGCNYTRRGPVVNDYKPLTYGMTAPFFDDDVAFWSPDDEEAS